MTSHDTVCTHSTLLADNVRGVHAWEHAVAHPSVRSALVDALTKAHGDGDALLAFALEGGADGEDEEQEDGEWTATIDGSDWTQGEAIQEVEDTLDGLEVAMEVAMGYSIGTVEYDQGAIYWRAFATADAWICPACACWLANADDSGIDTEEERMAVHAGVKSLGRHAYLLSDCGDGAATRDFSHSNCDACGGLAGQRMAVAIFDLSSGPVEE